MKKKCAVIVQGDKHQWVFYADGDDADLDAWAEDGLIVGDILNSIPAWLPDFLITTEITGPLQRVRLIDLLYGTCAAAERVLNG